MLHSSLSLSLSIPGLNFYSIYLSLSLSFSLIYLFQSAVLVIRTICFLSAADLEQNKSGEKNEKKKKKKKKRFQLQPNMVNRSRLFSLARSFAAENVDRASKRAHVFQIVMDQINPDRFASPRSLRRSDRSINDECERASDRGLAAIIDMIINQYQQFLIIVV